MTPPYLALRQELKVHLIRTAMTFSSEGEAFGEPTVMREVEVDVMLNNLLDYMIGKGYVQVNN